MRQNQNYDSLCHVSNLGSVVRLSTANSGAYAVHITAHLIMYGAMILK